ncbi:Type-1 restriction enzyme EcoEI specificity protein [Vibrio coralliirubri]|uniref:restriction endonuclease subunit S n=1 Tax=Vibrio coralliirubri TaxID=1516159 RepID=UPI0006318644|nr:restriction endonuclease subunit S [Vibrio coralliirubri]CDT71261.1 Type-1 restriction enzyme EcoEI specificity protein [Vibrio coralliirubri]
MSLDQTPMNQLITDNIDIWTSTVKAKSASGRGSSKKLELYGVKKLRELILELAVRGKLVPQDPTDEPASVLLERIAEEKAQLLKDKKIKSAKALPNLGNDVIPFDIPASWNWVRLGDIGYTQTGGTPKKANPEHFGSDVPFIKPADITELEVRYDNEGLSTEGANSLGRVAPVGSVLMVCIGTIGKCQLIEKDCAFNQQINSVTPFLPIGSFVFNTLRSSYFNKCAWELSSSTTIAILNKGKWESIPIPLPPVAEQHRIVAKVDELMTLCDQLEQQTEDSIEAHQVLVTTLLDTLTNSADADELMQNWVRISEHFDTLFTTEASIDQLKQTILQLAVMGKLVPQDPTDEPAAKLLERIAEEKTQLIKDKKIKKQKALPPIADGEKPFELPNGWEWCRFEDVVDIQSGITKGRKLVNRELKTIPYLSVANVQRGFLNLANVKEIELPVDELEKFGVQNGDLLITEGGDWDKVGRTAIWRDEIEYVAHQNHVFKARPFLSEQSEIWLETYLNAPFARDYFAGSSKQTTNLASINKTQLRGCFIAIPPKKEKQNIVRKVAGLMALCDQLIVRLHGYQATQIHLTDAIVEQAV